MPDMQPQIVLNLVGLTSAGLAHAPRLLALAQAGWTSSLTEVLPAVTCTAQASMLTGQLPAAHGIVANGWLFHDTTEVRFWQQSNHLLQSEPLYKTAARRSGKRPFRCAKLFWWFNQGAPVAISVTPKPHYGADGNKAFGIESNPSGLASHLENRLGRFPFASFWGPRAGLACTEWIAQAATKILADEKPDLTLVYLPHLDYAPQRLGPESCNMPQLIEELDRAVQPILDEATRQGAAVWIVNEYAHVPVDQVIEPNRALRRAGLLNVRPGPFGEQLDLHGSRAFAVCDHQIAHVYVSDWAYVERVHETIAALPGVAAIAVGDDRKEWGLDHPRSGEVIALAKENAWFAYPFWLNDRLAPDFARTVDIHRKPGYDPCELFLDPKLLWPTGRVLARLVQKKLGFRTLFDVIPLDPQLIRGSHGLRLGDPARRPVLIGPGTRMAPEILPMTGVRDLLLNALGLGD
jgi:predicted AlkP superfamily pyrophosphatase or phosphodiesterase